MHIMTVGCAPMALQFVFKTKESAEKAWATHADEAGEIKITDDYGQIGIFKAAAMSCRVLEDCALTKMAHIERSLHQQRMQNDAQKAAENDPGLRASLMRGGPAVLQPMGFNGRGN
jgi:hypothetical protein